MRICFVVYRLFANTVDKVYSNAFMASLNSRTGNALVQSGQAQNDSSMQWNSFGHIFNETNSGATVVRLQKSTHVSTSPALNDGTDKGVCEASYPFLSINTNEYCFDSQRAVGISS